MLVSGFTAAPVSKCLLFGIIASTIVASLTDKKHLFYIQVEPHIWKHRQIWRFLTWQLCYTNSTEILFAAMTAYHMRIIERLWGSRKFASFLLSMYLPTSILSPLLLIILRPLSFNVFNHMPAGPTPLIFALLVQFHAAVPTIYKYRIVTSSSSASDQDPSGLVFSDKTMTYLLGAQLALTSLPGSALAASVGWLTGSLWRDEIGPTIWVNWRVPGWVVGEGKAQSRRDPKSLRRRMQGEEGTLTGPDTADGGVKRRRLTREVVD